VVKEQRKTQNVLSKAFLIYSKQTPDSFFKRHHPLAFCGRNSNVGIVLQFFLISLAHFYTVLTFSKL